MKYAIDVFPMKPIGFEAARISCPGGEPPAEILRTVRRLTDLGNHLVVRMPELNVLWITRPGTLERFAASGIPRGIRIFLGHE